MQYFLKIKDGLEFKNLKESFKEIELCENSFKL